MTQRIQKRKLRASRVLLVLFILLLAAVLVLAIPVVLEELEKRTYPLVYPEQIEASASEFELDPYLVAAVVHCESGSNPNAVSGAGAIGLMQVMPDTGEWIAEKLSLANYQTEQLYQPEINIRLGCWYLRFLSDRYQADRVKYIAAYNAGQGNVDDWLDTPDYTKDGQLVNIPFAETERYVEKVQRAYEKFKTLYADAF